MTIVKENEKSIESYGCIQLKKIGIESYKFTSPSRRSVPDRLCIGNNSLLFFIEYKATGKKPTEAQKREHKRLRDKGFDVYVIDSKKQVDELVKSHEPKSSN